MQRILVTGANRGLGLEFVTQLLARGAHVIATCRDPGKANALNHLAAEHPGRLHVLPVDVEKPATIAELVRETALVVDGLDVLINNAGVLVPGERFGGLEAEALEHTLRVNTVGPVLTTQAFADLLRKGNTPKVANVSSQLGSIANTKAFGTPSYSISKAALNMAVVQMAHALETDGIPVLALHPGWAQTDMGGPQAHITPAEAVTGMLREIDALSMQTTGRFRDWQGRDLPW